MPRTKKMFKWEVVDTSTKLKKSVIVKSRTYIGACHKAFRKLGIPKPNFNTWTETFDGIVCYVVEEHLPSART